MSISADNIALSEEQKQYIALLAEQIGKPWDEVLRDALISYRPRSEIGNSGGADESFYDAAVRLGLIGCLRGGPPDLSTNPSHMEGFGMGDSKDARSAVECH